MGMLDGKLAELRQEVETISEELSSVPTAGLSISAEERRVLGAVLDRQRTALIVHGGLAGLLSLPPRDAEVLLDFLRRACS